MTFQCKENCGECCGEGMLFDREFFIAHENKAKRAIGVVFEYEGDKVYPATADRYCPFMGNDCKCAIYDERPELCRNFGVIEHLSCPYIDKEGNPRTQEETDRIHTDQIINDDSLNFLIALAIPDEFKGIETSEIEKIRKGTLSGDPFYVMAAAAIFEGVLDIKKNGGQKSINVTKEKYERVLKMKEEIDSED
jgi:Fe-S-cluster containining protein